MRRSTLFSILIAVLLAAGLAFWWFTQQTPGPTSPATQSAQGQERVKIGAILFLTGPDSSYGVKAKRGYELALDWGREKKFQKIPEIVYGDSASSEAKGVEELKRIAGVEGVKFIVGITGSGVAQAACPLLVQQGVFVLDALDSAATLSGCSPNFIRVYPSDVFQGRFLADWAYQNGSRKAVMISIQNAWGQGMAQGVRERFSTLGGKILLEEEVLPSTNDYTSLILKTKAASPDTLFLLVYPGNAKRWLEQAQARDFKVTTLGGDALTGAEVGQAGKAADGLMYSAPFPGEGPEYEAFVAKFQQKFGDKPDVYAIKSYDALRLAIQAINSTEINPQALRHYFLTMPTFSGIGGAISFDDKGDIKDVRYSRYIYNGGQSSVMH